VEKCSKNFFQKIGRWKKGGRIVETGEGRETGNFFLSADDRISLKFVIFQRISQITGVEGKKFQNKGNNFYS
jgi:hypothetical protein